MNHSNNSSSCDKGFLAPVLDGMELVDPPEFDNSDLQDPDGHIQYVRVISAQLVTFCRPFVALGFGAEQIAHELAQQSINLPNTIEAINTAIGTIIEGYSTNPEPNVSYTHHSNTCSKCGGDIIGDGYTEVMQCEYADDRDTDFAEPDSGLIECRFIEGGV